MTTATESQWGIAENGNGTLDAYNLTHALRYLVWWDDGRGWMARYIGAPDSSVAHREFRVKSTNDPDFDPLIAWLDEHEDRLVAA